VIALRKAVEEFLDIGNPDQSPATELQGWDFSIQQLIELASTYAEDRGTFGR
jgi:hypothetical protein